MVTFRRNKTVLSTPPTPQPQTLTIPRRFLCCNSLFVCRCFHMLSCFGHYLFFISLSCLFGSLFVPYLSFLFVLVIICSSSLFLVCFSHYLFLVSLSCLFWSLFVRPLSFFFVLIIICSASLSFGASKSMCLLIVAFLGYLHLYFDILRWSSGTRFTWSVMHYLLWKKNVSSAAVLLNVKGLV